MPEIKNTFTGGKMNKDLDERLVPPGEYRDALNIGIGRSEGADIGALENLLGNEMIGPGGQTLTITDTVRIPGTPGTPGETGWVFYGLATSGLTIGSNQITITNLGGATFTVGRTVSTFIPTNIDSDLLTIPEGDISNIYVATITSITNNMDGSVTLDLDRTPTVDPEGRDTLYQVEISTVGGTDGTPDTFETTRREVTIGAPGTCIGSIRDQNTDKVYWFTTGDENDAVWEFNQATGEILPLLRGDLNFSTDNLITGVNIIEGLLFWTDDRNEPRKLDVEKWRTEANNNSVPTQIYGRPFQERDITVIRPHPVERLAIEKDINADADNPPFEEIFPQFGYRWKYDDGEYSPFSSFTEEVFTPNTYDATEHYKEGYNTAVRNIVSSITVDNIPKGTPDVVSVDLLYRESISQTIYKLKTITSEDVDNWGTDANYTEPQVFNKRSFYAALPANQLSRQFDDVPRLAKSQEITANRLVYGNYLRNYPQDELVDITVSQRDHEANNSISIKGMRDYEVGVTYIDQFGRQGNLLVGDSVYTSLFSTEQTQRLAARINSDAPDWATHYKYFVKESSMDHHNLVAYNTYNDGDETHINSEFVWLQFSSNDRNKVQEDTFLIPRRHTQGEVNLPGNVAGTRLTSDETDANPVVFNANWGARGRVRTHPPVELWRGTGFTLEPRARTGRRDFVLGEITASVAGDYTFSFTGELHFEERDRRRWAGRAFIDIGYGISINGEEPVIQQLDRIKAPGNPKLSIMATTITATLEPGDTVTPVLYRRRNRDRGAVRFSMQNLDFRTLTTPMDPDAEPAPLELPGMCIPEYSRHAIIEIDNEAPDVVRNQLPVDLRRLGTATEYGGPSDNSTNSGFLVSEFGGDSDTPSMNSNIGATELYYEGSRNFAIGISGMTWIRGVNSALGAEGEAGVDITVDETAIDTIQTVDVSEIEGGIWFGFGTGMLAETGTEDKYRITEIAVGNTNAAGSGDGSSVRRNVVRITLDRPLEDEPRGFDFSVFKGDITDNALKNLQGSFFVKVPRATNNETYPFIGTAQSSFDMDNNVQNLQSVWFETRPLGEESNLNIYWESSESIPISNHGNLDRLDFFNCVAITDDCVFIETQRIYDRFNSVQMQKGLKANIPFEDYSEERRAAGMIYSGIFNSRTGTNRLNQFIYSDGITKELEPNYGSLQRLHTRDTNLIAFCEDKVFRILADKDMLFNADGGGNVSASNAVLGQTTPYVGEYGISKNPESFATYGSRMYFTDRARGVVLMLSQSGLDEVSRHGLSDYFRDELREVTGPVWGSFDDYHNLYNLRLNRSTLSFDSDTQGWPARKSFLPESGLTLNNIYYTFNNGSLWAHNSTNVPRNNFYGEQYCSSVTTIFNKEPSSIKNFKAFNYEGTGGWTAPLILTDQEAGRVPQFFNKEGKWFECTGALQSSRIIPIIEELMGDGIEDFYDEDSVEDGDFGEGDVYDFGDSTGDGMMNSDGDPVGGGDGDGGGMMGIGDMVDVTDGDGNPVDPADDANNLDEVTITFTVEPEE